MKWKIKFMFETTNQNVYTASQTSTFVGLAYAGQHVPCRFSPETNSW
jgi:rRNA maturation protein Nop10